MLLLHCEKENPPVVLIPNMVFRYRSFCCNESAKFEENLQKVFALSFESRETKPFSFNDILDHNSHIKGIKFARVV